MRTLQRLVPSMFHRRLLLLLVLCTAATGVLGARLYSLTVVQGDRLRVDAERALQSRRLLPTVRGRILDRHGRILAEDRPCSDIAASYNVITGQWAYDRARRLAYREYREAWGSMTFEQREQVISDFRGVFDDRLEKLWDMMCEQARIDRQELERRKATIVKRVQAIRSDVWDRRARREAIERGEPVEVSEVAIPIAEEREAHTLLPAVDDTAAHYFRRYMAREEGRDWPAVDVRNAKTRLYPFNTVDVTVDRDSLPSPIRRSTPAEFRIESVGGHLIGSLREVWAEDVQRRPFQRGGKAVDLGGYLPGDLTGLGGVEAAAEDTLRGLRGQLLTRRDTQQVDRHPPVTGRDVELTIDINLQARVRALFDPDFGLLRVQPWHANTDTPLGMPLYGTAVVIEVDSGEILAMVSTPMPPPRIIGEPYPDLSGDPDDPLTNKAIAAVYPPGSTLKPIVYAIAAADLAVQWDQTIDCQGHLYPDSPDKLRCWGWRPHRGLFLRHGSLGPIEAIARSCNIYFYTCGRSLGARRLVTGLEQWGFGRHTGIGLPEEVDGLMPSLEGRNPPGMALTSANATQMGIGQGPIAVPPLQVAAAHAALARGGYYLGPLLIRNFAEQQQSRDLNLPPRAVDNALRGMYGSANEFHGTAHHIRVDGQPEPIINLPGVIVRAKTGTAQSTPQKDPEGRVIRDGPHSWFVCHVQRSSDQRAAYVIAVMVEYGGSGGRVSGPLVNQILYALKAENYL